MISKPIIFSAPMIQALLAGKKSQTRRVMKPQPGPMALGAGTWYPSAPPEERHGRGKYYHYASREMFLANVAKDFCPHPVGSIMWVKETWQTDAFRDNVAPCLCSGSLRHYCADGPAPSICGFRWGKKRSSMFMPRWASRITLEVTAVKIERVQAISEEDARAEGLTPLEYVMGDGTVDPLMGISARDQFIHLWELLNGARPGCSWDANPFVWAYTFKRVEVTA